MAGMRGLALWARDRHLATAPGNDEKKSDDSRRPLSKRVVVARVVGWILVGLGLLAFLGFYAFGYLLGGPMILTERLFWEPLIPAILGAGLVAFARA